MRTNIEIDDALMNEALVISGLSTKRAVVEAALRQLLLSHQRRGILAMKGCVEWSGELDESRAGRDFSEVTAGPQTAAAE